MRNAPSVNAVNFTPARELDVGAGLLGFVAFTINGLLELGNVPVRRGRQRAPFIAVPIPAGHATAISVSVLDACAWAEIDRQVVAALERQGVLP